MSGAVVAGGAGAVVHQGHLRKLKTMKKKYFVLRAETSESSARLEYYESEKKFRTGSAARRILPLKSCYNITRRLDLKQKHVIALFTKEEQFCIVADNEKDLHIWLTVILRQYRYDDASEELLHPIQHVWQVNVQKKGLGASKNIQGLYNLCLTDKTLTMVKIKSHNNVISDLGIPERVEFALQNIRRCGDSECFFYMEVGRQTVTGAGEIWMHSIDSNIAQSMHSTIYHAMKNCTKDDNDRDHIVLPGRSLDSSNPLPTRRQTFSDGRGRSGVTEKGLCVGSCIRQCVCASATYSIDDSAAAIVPTNAEYHLPNNTLINDIHAERPRVVKHHRTVSLPAGCALFQEPLKIVHERTRSAPLTGDELDTALSDKAVKHSSSKTINGTDLFVVKKCQWSRRASTGTRLSKLSPAHTKTAGPLRSRCDSMPARVAPLEPAPRRTDREHAGFDSSRDDVDGLAEWHRTPRIPEEPDYCEMAPGEFASTSRMGMSAHRSDSSLVGDDLVASGIGAIAPESAPVGIGIPVPGYMPMAPGHEHTGLVSASSGSVCSGTPSTDPRFSEYQLEPATSHIVDGERPPRAYSVGSRPHAPHSPHDRHRAYSVGARHRPAHQVPRHHSGRASTSAPLLPRASADDLMELDFSNNTHRAAYSPPVGRSIPVPTSTPANRDEYVDMSPRNVGYLDMRPTPFNSTNPVIPTRSPPAVDGYVEMNYTPRPATRPIDIAGPSRVAPALSAATGPYTPQTPEDESVRCRPLGSQTIFPLSLDSPASPARPEALDLEELEEAAHPLTTLREISEEGRRSPEGAAAAVEPPVVRAGVASTARFTVEEAAGAVGTVLPLNYAALDLEPRCAATALPPRLYTQIDFVRSEKLHADVN